MRKLHKYEYIRGGSSLSIVYKCKHCESVVGIINQKVVNPETLGWNNLTSDEQQRLITYEVDGHITVKTICESCEQTLKNHPEYHALDHFIQ